VAQRHGPTDCKNGPDWQVQLAGGQQAPVLAAAAAIKREMAFVWSHTLSDLVGGQLSAGFRLLEFAEARRTDPRAPTINKYTNTYFMTAAEIVRS
jgi:hypothetical protein